MSHTSDQWGVYSKLRKLSNKQWLDYSMPDAIPKGIFPYPMLVHFLVSRLPERLWKITLVFTNLSCDLIVALLVFWGAFNLLHDLAGTQGAIPDTATLTALVFLTMPILLPITARMRDCNGRAPGMVLHTAYLLCIYMASSWNPYVFGLLGVAVLLAVFLTSFFAMQTAVFFSVGLSLWMQSLLPLSMVAAAVLIAFSLPRLGARDTLMFKINHFIWYWHNNLKNTTATGRNLLHNFLRFLAAFPKNRQESLTLFYRTSPLLIALYSVPVFWLLAFLLCQSGTLLPIYSHPLGRFSLGVSLIAILVFTLTSAGKLIIFGESERYFEYAAPFACIALAPALVTSVQRPDRFLLLLTMTQTMIVLFNEMTYTHRFFRWLRDEPLIEVHEEQAVMRRMLKLRGDVRVATIPIKLPILLTAFNVSPQSLHFYFRFIMQDGRLDGFRYYAKDTEEINVFSGTPERLAERYGITHILCQKSYLKPGTFAFIDALMTRNPLWEEKGYAFYQI